MLGRAVMEGEQGRSVLAETIHGLEILRSIGFEESVEGLLGVNPVRHHPNLMEHRLGFWLNRLWQIVQDIFGRMHPAALMSSLRFMDKARPVNAN